MSRINKILVGLVVIQAALCALTWTSMASKPVQRGSAKPIFGFEEKTVQALQVASKPATKDSQPEVVDLARKDGGWVLADRDDYPADKEKVDKILTDLLGLKLGVVLASNPANHNALKVGDREYDRKITVKSSAGSRTVMMGSGGTSSINVRYQGKNEVYRSNGVSLWSINSGVRSYIDAKYVAVDKDKLTSVVVTNQKGKLTFSKNDKGWTLAELPPGETLDDNKVVMFINKVSTLNLDEPLGREIKPEYGLPGATEVLLISSENGNTVTKHYTVGAQKGEQAFYAKADDNDYPVVVSKWSTEDIRNKTAADFVKQSEKSEKKAVAGAKSAP